MNLPLHCTILCTIYVLYTAGEYLNGPNVYRSHCRSDATFRFVAANTRLDASVIGQEIVQTLLMCIMRCIHDSLCKSINYNVKTKTCEKLSQNRASIGALKLVASTSWEHHEPETMQVTVSQQLLLFFTIQERNDVCVSTTTYILIFMDKLISMTQMT